MPETQSNRGELFSRPTMIRTWDRTDSHTGPSIFLRRLQMAGLEREDVLICSPTYLDLQRARRNRWRFLIARMDGVWSHTLSGRNLYGLVKKRYPSLLPFASACRLLPTCPKFLSSILTRLLNRHNVWLMKHARAVVFQSHLSREAYVKFLGHTPGGVPETVIPNGVDLEEFQPRGGLKLEGTPALIISSAVLRLHKRLQEAIRLVNHLARCYPEIRLHVLGNCDRLVYAVVSSLDTSRCVFHHRVAPQDLARFYAAADVQLSLGILDPCPNVVCEGLASGLPVVTPAESGAMELIGESNRHWTVQENLQLEKYRSLFVASEIPQIPMQRYAERLKSIVDNLPAEKERARARAEEALDIRMIAAKYADFIADSLHQSDG